MTDTIIHHADGSETKTDDWYDAIFRASDGGKVGDFWWGVEVSYEGDAAIETRVLWLIVPIPDERAQEGSYGPLAGGGELARLYPSHEGPSEKHPTGNWAAPGPVNGWDGNVDEPTFRPSIWVGGTTDHPGWHGFLTKGKLSAP